MKILKVVALVLSLIGIADSTYLTIHHYTAEPVPCSIIAGCETVLTSGYAEMAGVPLAAYGAAAYLVAFVLVLTSLLGNRLTWKLFGLQTVLMAVFSGWLIYVQAKLIGAFCQFCLLSAATTFSLFIVFIISLLISSRKTRTDLS
ncbi:MAG: vitamin K epoxide reductase family protein [Acidobacteriota bacterium]